MIWLILVFLYCLFCYSVSFCFLVAINVIYPNKTHKFKCGQKIRWRCKKCGINDDEFTIYHKHDQEILMIVSPISVPVIFIVYTVKHGVDFFVNVGPNKLAKYIRQHIKDRTVNSLKGAKDEN